jgi:preprotein translocase subunit SecE
LSKKVDRIMDEAENPEAQLPPPRAARFGEGRSARRERSVAPSRVGPAARLGQFTRDIRAEMRRVSWPSAKEVKNTTLITLVAVIFFAVYLFAVDQGLARLILGIDWLVDKLARFLGAG